MIKNSFKKSEELVDAFLENILGDDKGVLLKVREEWAESVGAELSKHTEPEEFKKGVLTVKVIGAVWRKELKMTAGKAVEKKLTEKYPKIKKVVWR